MTDVSFFTRARTQTEFANFVNFINLIIWNCWIPCIPMHFVQRTSYARIYYWGFHSLLRSYFTFCCYESICVSAYYLDFLIKLEHCVPIWQIFSRWQSFCKLACWLVRVVLTRNFDVSFCCNFSKHGSIIRLKRILSSPKILWIQLRIPTKCFDLIYFYLFPFESYLMFVELFSNWCWCEATTYPHQSFCFL